MYLLAEGEIFGSRGDAVRPARGCCHFVDQQRNMSRFLCGIIDCAEGKDQMQVPAECI